MSSSKSWVVSIVRHMCTTPIHVRLPWHRGLPPLLLLLSRPSLMLLLKSRMFALSSIHSTLTAAPHATAMANQDLLAGNAPAERTCLVPKYSLGNDLAPGAVWAEVAIYLARDVAPRFLGGLDLAATRIVYSRPTTHLVKFGSVDSFRLGSSSLLNAQKCYVSCVIVLCWFLSFRTC
jgi:hypothetical protein